eukprot:Opistho-1_new@108869
MARGVVPRPPFPPLCEFFPTCDPTKRVYYLSDRPLLQCPLCALAVGATEGENGNEGAGASNEPSNLSQSSCGATRVRIESPLVNGHCHPRCILVKTTYGFFHRDYTSTALLHVGVSNSQGCVYNFDEHGFHRDHTRWDECVAVPLSDCADRLSDGDFDAALETMMVTCAADPHLARYDGMDNNCYDFVARFLNFLLYFGSSDMTKEEYCRRMLTHRIEVAGGFATCFRRLLRDPFVVISNG